MLAGVGIEIKGVFDTLTVSRTLRGTNVLGGHGLAMVCERELGASLDKGEQTSDWARRPLSPQQLDYAALDAEILLPLHERFSGEMLAVGHPFDCLIRLMDAQHRHCPCPP